MRSMPAFSYMGQICLRQTCRQEAGTVQRWRITGLSGTVTTFSHCQSSTCMTRRRRGLCMHHFNLIALTPDDDTQAKKSDHLRTCMEAFHSTIPSYGLICLCRAWLR